MVRDLLAGAIAAEVGGGLLRALRADWAAIALNRSVLGNRDQDEVDGGERPGSGRPPIQCGRWPR